jgi:hypothetical protein
VFISATHTLGQSRQSFERQPAPHRKVVCGLKGTGLLENHADKQTHLYT